MTKDIRQLLVEAKAVYEEAFGKHDESWWKGIQPKFDVLKLAGYMVELLQLDYYERSLAQKNRECDRLERRDSVNAFGQ